MTNAQQRPSPRPWPRSAKVALTLMLTLGIGGFIVSRLPGAAYPTDLSLIGNGRPALVLTQDSNYTAGMAVMELMNRIRGDYAGQVDFLVAYLGMPEGQAFARAHSTRDGVVMLFGKEGQVLGTLNQPEHANQLRQSLDQALGR